jgi:sec-independent protein translocase protein TatC
MIRRRSREPKRPTLKTPDDAMTLTEHLAELRVRIIRSALAVVVGAIVVIAFYDQVL